MHYRETSWWGDNMNKTIQTAEAPVIVDENCRMLCHFYCVVLKAAAYHSWKTCGNRYFPTIYYRRLPIGFVRVTQLHLKW